MRTTARRPRLPPDAAVVFAVERRIFNETGRRDRRGGVRNDLTDDRLIDEAAAEVLRVMNLGENRFTVEPALGAPGENARQIRLCDENGGDRTTVVSFENADGEVAATREAVKGRIRKQLPALVRVGGL